MKGRPQGYPRGQYQRNNYNQGGRNQNGNNQMGFRGNQGGARAPQRQFNNGQQGQGGSQRGRGRQNGQGGQQRQNPPRGASGQGQAKNPAKKDDGKDKKTKNQKPKSRNEQKQEIIANVASILEQLNVEWEEEEDEGDDSKN